MKKIIISAVVGGLILFIWQFISWNLAGIHKGMQEYTTNQKLILDFLSENMEEGFYMLPLAEPGEDPQEAARKAIGKPWAQIYYHEAMQDNMASNISRGLLIDILIVGLLAWLMSKIAEPSFKNILILSLVVGFISFLSISYTNAIWFGHKAMGDLIDTLIAWTLVGSWLGWYLNSKKTI